MLLSGMHSAGILSRRVYWSSRQIDLCLRRQVFHLPRTRRFSVANVSCCSTKGPGKPDPEEGSSKQPKALQRISDALDSRIQDIMTYIMPRERGDARDWALMWTSIAIFVYTAMHAYRLYAHMYYTMGLRPILHTLAR